MTTDFKPSTIETEPELHYEFGPNNQVYWYLKLQDGTIVMLTDAYHLVMTLQREHIKSLEIYEETPKT